MVAPHRLADIYDAWVAEGKPWCEHRNHSRVQDMGSPPEEIACTTCGMTWDIGKDVPPPRGNQPE